MRKEKLIDTHTALVRVGALLDALYEQCREWRSDGKEVTTEKTRIIEHARRDVRNTSYGLSEEITKILKKK